MVLLKCVKLGMSWNKRNNCFFFVVFWKSPTLVSFGRFRHWCLLEESATGVFTFHVAYSATLTSDNEDTLRKHYFFTRVHLLG